VIAQVRIYTINKGEMDAFLQHFLGEVKPLHDKLGIQITSMLVNRPQNEFIWVRTYADEADRDAKSKAFQEAPERAAMGSRLGASVAKMEVREVEVIATAVPAS
jgi:hypothetical protein